VDPLSRHVSLHAPADDGDDKKKEGKEEEDLFL
jgi:hypothetical protein